MRAVTILDGVDFKKHSALISYFHREYIHTKKFDVVFSRIITKTFNYRQRSDYEDFYVAHKIDAEEQYENAKLFLAGVEKYLKMLYSKLDDV